MALWSTMRPTAWQGKGVSGGREQVPALCGRRPVSEPSNAKTRHAEPDARLAGSIRLAPRASNEAGRCDEPGAEGCPVARRHGDIDIYAVTADALESGADMDQLHE